MQAVRESWTDERLDHLSEKTEEGFAGVDKRLNQIDSRLDRFEGRVDTKFAQIDEKLGKFDARLDQGFGRIDARLDSIGKAIIYMAVTFSSVMIAGFVTILTQI